MTTTTLLERSARSAVATGFIDCDIHPALKSPKALYPYLEKRWQEHLAAYGSSGHGPHVTAHA